jgi:hypothetical protein
MHIHSEKIGSLDYLFFIHNKGKINTLLWYRQTKNSKDLSLFMSFIHDIIQWPMALQNVAEVLTGRGLMNCWQYYDNCPWLDTLSNKKYIFKNNIIGISTSFVHEIRWEPIIWERQQKNVQATRTRAQFLLNHGIQYNYIKKSFRHFSIVRKLKT